MTGSKHRWMRRASAGLGNDHAGCGFRSIVAAARVCADGRRRCWRAAPPCPRSGPTAAQINGALKKHNQTGFTIVDIDAASAADARPRAAAGRRLAHARPRPAGSIRSGGRRADDQRLRSRRDAVHRRQRDQRTAQGGAFNPSARAHAARTTCQGRCRRYDPAALHRSAGGRREDAARGRADDRARAARPVAAPAGAGRRQGQRAQHLLHARATSARRASYRARRCPRERLLDALARAGGTDEPARRHGRARDPRRRVGGNAAVAQSKRRARRTSRCCPATASRLFNRPRTFLRSARPAKVSQVDFSTNELSLAEALARIARPERARAPTPRRSICSATTGTAGDAGGTPVIYRLNMMRADSYFLSQRIGMRDKDVDLHRQRRVQPPGKLASILGQFFSPDRIRGRAR